MAFRILSEQEVELLSEKKKEQYLRKLDLYMRRTKFLSGLDAVENLDVKIEELNFDYLNGLEDVGKKKFLAPRFEKENIRTIGQIKCVDKKVNIGKNEAVKVDLNNKKPIIAGKKYIKPVGHSVKSINVKKVKVESKEVVMVDKRPLEMPSLLSVIPNKKIVDLSATFIPRASSGLESVKIEGHKFRENYKEKVLMPKVNVCDINIAPIRMSDLQNESVQAIVPLNRIKVKKTEFSYEGVNKESEKICMPKVQIESKKEFILPDIERRESAKLSKCDIQRRFFAELNQEKISVKSINKLDINYSRMKECGQSKHDISENVILKAKNCKVLFDPFELPNISLCKSMNVSKVVVDKGDFKNVATEILFEKTLPCVKIEKKDFSYEYKECNDKIVCIESVYVPNMEDYLNNCIKT